MIDKILVTAMVLRHFLHFRTDHWSLGVPLVDSEIYGTVAVRSKVTGHFSYVDYGVPDAMVKYNLMLQRVRAVVVEESLNSIRASQLVLTCKRSIRNDYPRPTSTY